MGHLVHDIVPELRRQEEVQNIRIFDGGLTREIYVISGSLSYTVIHRETLTFYGTTVCNTMFR